ncbi:MAG: AAA family ATPase [Frisingicoccus sp.]|uniref:AAA family ATPase n=1 Tax=Frisingicoccus sp. TaxID=1918627 RepID=UPI00261BC298|nr:AAA family ATPase [Frisingicoccus sp.]MDD6233136.1 AAA family ATPase [Frisingicoccus sp.]
MAKTVGIGIQNFDKIIENQYFYIDKTSFIKEWWESGDDVTLITRPRRFGKTLNMSMVEEFFSIDYAKRGDLFQGLSIWKEEKFRKMQGTYPVISLSFARIKETNYDDTRERILQIIRNLYIKFSFLKDSAVLEKADKAYFDRILGDKVSNPDLTAAIYQLSGYLYRYYGKKVIILLDEYDTPMQEAYVDGFLDELVGFTRSMFNSTFKTNPWLERAIMTGITRVSKESIFSDLNNLKVVTTTSEEYAESFGFTEKEVFDALDEYGLSEKKQEVKLWYDGFIFGKHKDIYNPWSILNYLDTGKLATYWANTSSNSLANKLLQEGNRRIKEKFEILLRGESIQSPIDEQIAYNQLNGSERSIWSLFLASGYLKVLFYESYLDIPTGTQPQYELALTNFEVRLMFQNMISNWFSDAQTDYNDFVQALLIGDLKAMNAYMNRVALNTFSYFDTGKRPSGEEPERFYHGFVLGLIVDLQNRYVITSNRESGFGRYDVMLEPRNSQKDDAILLEFKIYDPDSEKTMKDTVQEALAQIERKQYAAQLINRGISKDHIRSYGFAFQGKHVLIG